ncbi:MAG TPA: VOC family protein [Geminicoccaceae bacterium]|nr:VOC family protein [Geminicoccaceae bacterium]
MGRSRNLRVLLALGGALALLAAIAIRPAGAGVVQEVDSVTITVSDMDRALAFYEDVLSFETVSDVEVADEAYDQLLAGSGLRLRIARMRLGAEFIELMQVIAPEGRPIPGDSHSNDLWFQHIAIITPDMARAYAWLREHEVRHSSPAPQRLPDWNPDAGGIEAFYFKDPDGNNLEILAFPEGKGDPKWQEPSEHLFLGIDHTAIAVADTEESLAFWRDALGLKVVGESENYGLEQERLNNVAGAHLRITALRAPAGPGVELLEYLAPEGGRPFPADTNVSDLWHWQINVTSPDVGAATATCIKPCVPVSPGVIELTDDIGLRSSALIRDPDGHAVLLADR